MALKLETIAQYEGFGNRRQKRKGEHFRSSGFTLSALGMTASRRIKTWFSDIVAAFPQQSAIGTVTHWAASRGFPITSGGSSTYGNKYVFFLDDEQNIYGSKDGTDDPQLLQPEYNSSHTSLGLIGDQKNRLLFPGIRYLGRFDPYVDHGVVTVSVTNGSDVITKTGGDDFALADERCFLLLFHGGDNYFFRIDNYTSTTQVEIFGNITLPTGSYSGYVMRGWVDRWKDFGSTIDDNDSDGEQAYIPTERYEDTVIFMRKNNVTTLNVTTDTVTTDASPAFNMPTGYDPIAAHKGSNGILLCYNFQRKGVLVLWDNYSDRAIAPWIDLPDRIISVSKYLGNWLVITASGIYLTNGYTSEILTDKLLDMDIAPLAKSNIPQTSLVVENDLYFLADFSLAGKRRAGLHKFNLKTRLCEYVPKENMNQKEQGIFSIFYGTDANRIYAGQDGSVAYMEDNVPPTVSAFITNPAGAGENIKYGESVKLDLGISPNYSAQDSPFSVEVAVKVCPLEKQVINYGLVKTTQTVANQIVVNETTYGAAEVGDEIEFLMGNNGGYSRNITAKSGTGATVTYTLDRDLPLLSAANDYFFRTHFKLVRVKQFTDVAQFSADLLTFVMKNRPQGQKYLVKVELEEATVPIELRPIQLLYEDLGAI